MDEVGFTAIWAASEQSALRGAPASNLCVAVFKCTKVKAIGRQHIALSVPQPYPSIIEGCHARARPRSPRVNGIIFGGGGDGDALLYIHHPCVVVSFEC